MARKWCGFLPQNLRIKEEWELLEACEAQARHAEQDLSRARADREQERNRLARSK